MRSLREPRFIAVTRIPKTILCARKLWKRATDHQDVVKDVGDELQEIKKERVKEQVDELVWIRRGRNDGGS